MSIKKTMGYAGEIVQYFEIKEFAKYMKENKTARAATICGMFVGAFFGVLAFYNGWLG